MPSTSQDRGFPKGYQQLTVSSTAVGLTLPNPSCNGAIITIETQGDIRWRDDNVAPDANTGHLCYAGNQVVELTNHVQVTQFQAIRAGSSDVTMNITYYHKN